jgi:hypothetical protein
MPDSFLFKMSAYIRTSARVKNNNATLIMEDSGTAVSDIKNG